MPDLGELLGGLVRFIGDQVGESSLRLGPVPAISIFLIALVLLSLVARPTTRWATRDLGRLGRVPRAMALAAESGAAAAFSLGTAGLVRATSAAQRLQTLAAMPILGHVARAAARSGVPLRVTTNDPVVAQLAEGALHDAHEHTDTLERADRSRVEYLGEGRATAAGLALATRDPVSTSYVMGGLSEESILLAMGHVTDSGWSSVGTATAAQANTPELTGEGALIGPELFLAGSDLQPTGHERTGVQAGNRLIAAVIAILVLGSLVAVLAGFDVTSAIAGH